MYANVLRAGTLNDERVVRVVSTNFVPTHFNNNDPTRSNDDPSLALWKRITAQKSLQGQGIWIVAPDGKVIGGMSAEVDGHPSDKAGNGPGAPWRANPKFTTAVLELLEQTLREFGQSTPRKAKASPLPFRGAGIRPDGGVRLVAYNRADSGLAFSIPLTKNDWWAFAPASPTVGTQWSVGEAVARHFGPVLSPYADTRFRPQPKDVVRAELYARVEEISGPTARIRLWGQWKADWVHDNHEHSIGVATAEGFASFDLKSKEIQSLLLIFDGSYSYTPGKNQPPRSQNSAAVVQWRLSGDAE